MLTSWPFACWSGALAVGSAVAEGESISARDVGLFRVVKHTYNRLNRLGGIRVGKDKGYNRACAANAVPSKIGLYCIKHATRSYRLLSKATRHILELTLSSILYSHRQVQNWTLRVDNNRNCIICSTVCNTVCSAVATAQHVIYSNDSAT